MEVAAQQFEMPRELTGPMPRRLRRRSGIFAGCVFHFGRLFILPHMIVGMVLIFMVPVTFAKVFFGTLSQGVIVKKWIVHGEDTSYRVKYEYDAHGVHRSGERTVRGDDFKALGNPAQTQPPIQIRSVHVLGRHFHEALLPGESRVWKVFFYVFLGVFWNGVLSIFVYVMYIGPWREKQLYRWGTPVPGRIYSKETRPGEDTSYHLHYEFIQPQMGMLRKEQTVSRERFNETSEGQLVTVLCYPHKKSPAVMYEFGGFECV